MEKTHYVYDVNTLRWIFQQKYIILYFTIEIYGNYEDIYSY